MVKENEKISSKNVISPYLDNIMLLENLQTHTLLGGKISDLAMISEIIRVINKNIEFFEKTNKSLKQ